MRVLSATVIAARNLLNDSEPWVHLLKIEMNPSQTVFLTNDNESIVFGGETYLPFPFVVGPLTEDARGNLNTRTLSASNLNLDFTRMLRQQRGLPNATVTLALFRLDEVILFETYKVKASNIADDAASFTLGLDSLNDREFPGRKYDRVFCGWTYGSGECGVPDAIRAIKPACSRLLNDANGCVKTGQVEFDNSLTRVHPGRFGAFAAQPRE